MDCAVIVSAGFAGLWSAVDCAVIPSRVITLIFEDRVSVSPRRRVFIMDLAEAAAAALLTRGTPLPVLADAAAAALLTPAALPPMFADAAAAAVLAVAAVPPVLADAAAAAVLAAAPLRPVLLPLLPHGPAQK